MDKLKGSFASKTSWFALALVVIGAVQGQTDLLAQVAGNHLGVVSAVLGVIVYALRWVTTEPLENKA